MGQQKRNDKKLIDKTPQEIGNELTLLYNGDKLIKEVLDEEFEKRAIRNKKETINPKINMKYILYILGLIAFIYISSYIIVQTARNSEKRANQTKQLKTAQYQGKHAIHKKLSAKEIRKKTSIPKDPAP